MLDNTLFCEFRHLLRSAWSFLQRRSGWVLGSLFCLVMSIMLLAPYDGALHEWVMHERPDKLARLARGGREWGKFIDTPLICGALYLLGWACRRARWRRAALAAFLAATCAGLTANLIRSTTGRARPHQGAPMQLIGPTLESNYHSFPSAHTATSGGYAFALAVAQPALAPLALLSGGWVIWSSFYAGSHYPSDILVSLWISGWIGLALGMAARQRRTGLPPAADLPGDSRDASVPTDASPRKGSPSLERSAGTIRHIVSGEAASHFGRRVLLPLLLLAALLLLPGTGRLPLMDRDEPRFAQATREMQQRHDWVIPTFNQAYRFDKPPLTYWLMAPGYRLLGETELGARLHSVISTLLLALLIYAFGRMLGLRREAATAAAAAMLFSAQFLAHGRAAVADMPMVLCVTATLYALYGLLCRTPGRAAARRLRLLLCLSLSLGFLAKGPIAWLTPLLALLLFRWVLFRHHPLPWRRLGLEWVASLSLLGVAIWGIPALRRTQGEFWEVGIGYHVVERGVRPFHDRLFLPFYYPFMALISLFPWSTRFGAVWRLIRSGPANRASAQAAIRNPRCEHPEPAKPVLSPSDSPVARQTIVKDARIAFLVAWLVAPMLIFLFYATQLPHYTLPGFPAFFLLLGLVWDRPENMPRWGLRLKQALLAIGILGSVLLLSAGAAAPVGTAWRLALAGAGLALAGLTLAPVLAPRAQVWRLLPAALMVGLGLQGAATGIRDTHVVLGLRDALDALPPDTVCHVLDYREPSLVFYSRRHWLRVPDAQTAAAALRSSSPACVVVLEHEIRLGTLIVDILRQQLGGAPRDIGRHYRQGHDALPASQRIAVSEGFSPARGVMARLALYATPSTTENRTYTPATEPEK